MKVNSIARNTSYFTMALIFQKIISFSYFALMARYLLPEDLGKYYLAISFTTIFAIIIDLGLANVLTRETAKLVDSGDSLDDDTRKTKKELFRSVLFIKIPLAVISVLAVLVFSNILAYSLIVKQLIYISVISMVLDSFTTSFWSYVRGHHILKYESIGVVLFQTVSFGLGFTFLVLGYNLYYLMGVMAMASAVNFLYSLFLVQWKFKVSILPIYKPELLKRLLSLSIPFAVFAVLQRLYMFLDSVLLSALADDKSVGLYQIAFKIVFALQFLPMAFVASLYPAFSLYYKENKEQLGVSFERAMNYLLIISLPISLGTILLSDQIMMIFKPEYIDAVWPLRVVMLSLIFIFINFPIGSLLNACDRQKTNTLNMAIVLTTSVVLNIWLIPKYQALGASITVLATNILMFILGVYYVPKIAHIRFSKIFSVFLKACFSLFLMGLVVYFLKERVNIFINIIFSAIIYVISLFLVGGFSKHDLASILKSLK